MTLFGSTIMTVIAPIVNQFSSMRTRSVIYTRSGRAHRLIVVLNENLSHEERSWSMKGPLNSL